jgi:hypothetical protein
MGELLERSKLGELVYGAGLLENYKNNSLYFFSKFKESDKFVTSINPKNIQPGGFYFFHYKDDSNWMKYSPLFVIDFKKFSNILLVYAINLNFLPIELRFTIFDKFITEDDLDKDRLLDVDFDGVYKELRSLGFEYAIVEYNFAQIKLCHKINMELSPRFLYSGHPINKYDPKKLYSIWQAKLEHRTERDSEMSTLLVNDFLKMKDEAYQELSALKGHVERLRRSISKYG